MAVSLYHVQLNVSDAKRSLPFYKRFFGYLGYQIIDESPEHIGFSNSTTDFWIIQTEKSFHKALFHRKNTGINHLAFRVDSKEAVDRFFKEFLNEEGISVLYSTPRVFPEYKNGYYAVFFEDPDRIKIEIVFVPQ